MDNREIDQIRGRIRQLRREKGLTLLECEIQSRGRIRAVVLGAYERGDRSMSLKKVIEIAELFEVPLAHLIAAELHPEESQIAGSRHIYDLRALRALSPSEQKILLSRYLSRIAEQRGDWAGEVISIRQADVEAIARLVDSEEINFQEWVATQKILLVRR
ncbi:MAG: helix-turn-helix domain-containing protein [Candidatus Planktophila sp.]